MADLAAQAIGPANAPEYDAMGWKHPRGATWRTRPGIDPIDGAESADSESPN